MEDLTRGGGTSFFPVKHEKFPFHKSKMLKISLVKPLNSGEAVASPVPPPLKMIIFIWLIHVICCIV